MMKALKSTIISMTLLLSVQQLSASTIFVNKSAVGGNNGTSWTHAYTTLNKALENAKANDEIWVAKGTYYINDEDAETTGCGSLSIVMRDGITIYGSLDGTEGIGFDMEDRDLVNDATIISGDLNTNGIFDLSDAELLLSYSGVSTSTSIIDGIQFIHAHRAIKINDGSLEVRNCQFSEFENDGGLLAVTNSTLTIDKSLFHDNEVYNWGAVIRSINSTVDVYNSRFNSNRNYGKKSVMASVLLPESSICTFYNSVFYGNASYDALPFEPVASTSELYLINCSFDNTTVNPSPSEVYFSQTDLKNTIIWESDILDDILNASSSSALYNCITPGGYSGTALQFGNPNYLSTNLDIDNTSPAYENGDATYNSTLSDIAGNPRLSDLQMDIGAYEYCAGCSRLKSPELVEEDTEAPGIVVYPNPSNGKITVETPEILQYQLVDVTGKTVYQGRLVEGRNELNFSHLQRGIYIFRPLGKSEMTKLIIN